MSSAKRFPFEVFVSAEIAEKVRGLQRRASRTGRGESILQAFRTVLDRLGTIPDEFGEPLYQLPALRMQIRCAVVRPLIIDFGVCDDRPVVYVKAVRSLDD